MQTFQTLTLDEAHLILDAAQAKCREMGVLQVLCVADNAGYPIALRRLDGGKVTSVQIAMNKAFTAACHRRPTDQYKNAQINNELLPETLGLQAWCYRQSQRPFVEAIAAINVGLESQVPVVYAKTTPPLIEKYGFTEEEITFFRLHIVADQEHGERAFNIVEKYAATPEQRATCLRLVKEATGMRRLYLDGLYNKYLANPVQKAA